MKTFYIIQMIDGKYVQEDNEFYMLYCDTLQEAARFDSKKEAIKRAPANQPFTVIKFYDK